MGPPAVVAKAQGINVVKEISRAILGELHDPPVPWLVAVISLVFGFVLVCDGASVFKTATCVAIGFVVALLAKASVYEYWIDHEYTHWAHKRYISDVVGVEVGLVAALAAYKGY